MRLTRNPETRFQAIHPCDSSAWWIKARSRRLIRCGALTSTPPTAKGFLYLVEIIDLHSRHVLSRKLSNSLDSEFCLEALEMALSSGRRAQIFHSDQGCQFTSTDFVSRLQAEEIKISWLGGKRFYNNIRVERLYRNVKYIAEGFSAMPSRYVHPCLQRWLGD